MKSLILILSIAATGALAEANCGKSHESASCPQGKRECAQKKAKASASVAGSPQIPLYNQESGKAKKNEIPLYSPVAANEKIETEKSRPE